MDATQPLLTSDTDGDDISYHQRVFDGRHDDAHRSNGRKLHQIEEDGPSYCCCLRKTSRSSNYTEIESDTKYKRSNSYASTGSSAYSHSNVYGTYDHDDEGSFCSKWMCWKWIFPDRISDYDDFVSSEEVNSFPMEHTHPYILHVDG